MHALIALIATVFSASFDTAGGGELVWTKSTNTTPIVLELNSDPVCTVGLTSDEAQWVAEVMIDVVDNGGGGKTTALVNGGTIGVRDLGGGDVRLATNGILYCRVELLASEEEPEKVLGVFMDAAAS